MTQKNEKRKRFHVGVIGLGFMGDHHTRISSSMRGIRLAGIFDQDRERAEAVSTKYNTKIFPDIQSLIDAVDAVIVATPTSTHFDIAMRAIGAGKHVFVEKPLAMNSQQGSAMVLAAKEKGVVLACGFVERFNPAFTLAEALLKKDKPLIMNVKRESPLPERITDADVVLDMMIHDLDLVLKLTGSVPQEIKAKGKRVKTKMLDRAFASIFFKNGIIANIEASRVSDQKLRTLSIDCEHSTITADLLGKKVRQKFMPDPSAPTIEPPRVDEHIAQPADQITLELKDFFSAAKKDREPAVSGTDALASLRLVEAIEKSIKGE